MNAPQDDPPIFNYVASVNGREFIVTITQSMMSQWEDLKNWTLADRLYDQPPASSIISVPASEEIFLKAAEMAQKEKVQEARTGQFPAPSGETAKDMAELDQLFEEFFWRKINRRLKQPLNREPLIGF